MAKSAAKSTIVNALEFLSDPKKHPARHVCAVYGDDGFLKMEVMAALRREAAGGSEREFALSIFSGRDAQLREVFDALATRSLFGSGRQLVTVEEADPFVTQFREQLEDYVARPAKGSVLVLDVKTWPSNTRLAKAVATDGLTIDCRSYESLKGAELTARTRQMKRWLTDRATNEHQVRLDSAAVDALFELVPPELGILIQEIDKLALFAGQKGTIDVDLVRNNVGGWRVRAIWDMIDAAADGRGAEALAQFNRLIISGEKPQGLLPQIATSLRRFSAAVNLLEEAAAERRPLSPRGALEQAGVPPFVLPKAERQLRRMGRQRARQITGWLIAADLAMKGHNSADDRARIELEKLIVRLAADSHADPPNRSGASAARLAAPMP
jgi:DNA polymerase III subunit delta